MNETVHRTITSQNEINKRSKTGGCTTETSTMTTSRPHRQSGSSIQCSLQETQGGYPSRCVSMRPARFHSAFGEGGHSRGRDCALSSRHRWKLTALEQALH